MLSPHSRYCLVNSLLARRSGNTHISRANERGFSLIELVVVIAVLAILIAIALPNFLGVQRDARVSSVKNNLSNIIKECGVRESRGNPADMGDAARVEIASSLTTISGFEMSGFPLAAVAATVLPPATNGAFGAPVAPANANTLTCYAAAGNPIAAERGNYLTFSIFYDRASGQVIKRCNGPVSAYREGCFRNADLTGGAIAGGGAAGYW